MKEQLEATALADTREVLITRIYDAPPGLLFEAWSDPEYLKHWYAPEGCKSRSTNWISEKMDVLFIPYKFPMVASVYAQACTMKFLNPKK